VHGRVLHRNLPKAADAHSGKRLPWLRVELHPLNGSSGILIAMLVSFSLRTNDFAALKSLKNFGMFKPLSGKGILSMTY
jgi:hypothetical protein